MRHGYTDDPEHMVAPDIIQKALEAARDHGCHHIFYTGYADRDLITAFIAAPDMDISIMDMFNRTNVETHFWDDDGICTHEDFPVPEWLGGIPCYSEGGPEQIDMWIRDIPWDTPDQLQRCIDFHRNSFYKVIFLLAPEDRLTDHPLFTWHRHEGYIIGCRK